MAAKYLWLARQLCAICAGVPASSSAATGRVSPRLWCEQSRKLPRLQQRPSLLLRRFNQSPLPLVQAVAPRQARVDYRAWDTAALAQLEADLASPARHVRRPLPLFLRLPDFFLPLFLGFSGLLLPRLGFLGLLLLVFRLRAAAWPCARFAAVRSFASANNRAFFSSAVSPGTSISGGGAKGRNKQHIAELPPELEI